MRDGQNRNAAGIKSGRVLTGIKLGLSRSAANAPQFPNL
jgi:hypothetical protein